MCEDIDDVTKTMYFLSKLLQAAQGFISNSRNMQEHRQVSNKRNLQEVTVPTTKLRTNHHPRTNCKWVTERWVFPLSQQRKAMNRWSTGK